MGIQPNIKKERPFMIKECSQCHGSYGPEAYTKTKSIFYPDGYLPMCNNCLEKILIENEFNWEIVDKICQYADIPFVPAEFVRLQEINNEKVFPIYAEIFFSSEYENLGWGDYFQEFKKLKQSNEIEEELPIIKDDIRKKLKEKWGSNYDDEELNYLEKLYNGLLMTQNISGALQGDQALKICKISLEIDARIREGVDFDKMLASYDKLVKTAEFTPKNVKNASDFESTGELVKWLEKRNFKNKFFDNITRDIVDETIKNIQSYNQRLYVNENGIGEEISRRIEALNGIKEMETYYGVGQEQDLDKFEVEGYDELFADEEFEAELGE